MQFRFGVRRLLIGATWALALATWGSIAHFFFGTPDVGFVVPVVLGVVIGAAPAIKATASHPRLQASPS